MSKFDKIIEKLLNPGSTITFKELEYILKNFKYSEKKTGKTSGSRKALMKMQVYSYFDDRQIQLEMLLTTH